MRRRNLKVVLYTPVVTGYYLAAFQAEDALRGGGTQRELLSIDMRVQFTFTQEDLVDASKRFLARSKVVRTWKWQGLLSTALVSGLVVFFIFYPNPIKGAIFGSLAALINALIYPSLHKSGVDRRLRNLHRENLGDVNSFLCEVELRADGVFVRQMNKQTLYEWASIGEIEETEDSVDLITRDGAGVIVRNRAFNSAAERTKFIELAKAGVNDARSQPALQ